MLGDRIQILCGVRIPIHGSDSELIAKSCERSSGLTAM